MGVLGRKALVRRCADATGLSEERCEEVFGHVIEVLGSTIRQGRVMIDNFGVFGPVDTAAAKNGHRYFRPAQPLVEAVSAHATASQETLAAPARVRCGPLRPEDDEIIERWLLTRRGAVADVVSESDMYEESQRNGRRRRRQGPASAWSAQTISTARRTMRAFARYCKVPVALAGLVGNPGLGGVFDPEELTELLHAGRISPAQHRAVVGPLRAPIQAYGNDYSRRAQPRLERLAKSKESGPDLVWRTVGWTRFVRFSLDFYGWLEAQDLRPAGSNPVRGIKRHNPIDFSKDKITVALKWYRAVLEYPHMTPRERAILYLLANGLRADEVAGAMLDRITLAKASMQLVGKGNKVRTVPLNPWTAAAITTYLESRRFSTNPRLFYTRTGGRITGRLVWAIVKSLAARAFPLPEQEAMRQHIHPHGFRHYFITTSLNHGMNRKLLRDTVGHTSYGMLDRYTHPDNDAADKELKRITRKPWFMVPQ